MACDGIRARTVAPTACRPRRQPVVDAAAIRHRSIRRHASQPRSAPDGTRPRREQQWHSHCEPQYTMAARLRIETIAGVPVEPASRNRLGRLAVVNDATLVGEPSLDDIAHIPTLGGPLATGSSAASRRRAA
jgi:hypothetical protein